MLLPWLWLAPLVALGAAGPGSSLRGAVEALQRRQRAQVRLAPPQYDALYEFIPPGYPEPDYTVDVDDMEEGSSPKLIVKLLEENEHPLENYEYKVIKKKSSNYESSPKKESAFRERSHHSDNDRLRDLFSDKNEIEEERRNEAIRDHPDSDAEYALLLSQLWSKYKGKIQQNNQETVPQGVVKLYKEKLVQKRYPDSWGPIAFKRKRSSDSDIDRPVPHKYETNSKAATSDSNYNTYDVSDNDKDDWREEYAIAFQPLDDDSMTDNSEEQYSYDNADKRFPVTKRGGNLYDFNNQKKRFAQNQKLKAKSFRSSAGTDPRIIKDLSRIFGDRSIKNPVKRNVDQEDSREVKPPKLTELNINHTHDRINSSKQDYVSHEHHEHNMQHPGISGKEAEYFHDHDHEHHEHNMQHPEISGKEAEYFHDHEHNMQHPGISEKEVEYFHDHNHDHNHSNASSKDDINHEKPKIIRKKSIDWSDYFGIDKRTRNHPNDESQNRLRKQYFNTFNREVVYPTNSFRKHTYSKRNYVDPKQNTMSEVELNRLGDSNSENKRNTNDNDSKLDNIDKKLRNMEGMLVDDALRYSEVEEELDSKEEQEMKEKLLSRLAAAYSLEKMRKALKEFKQTLQTPRPEISGDLSTAEAKAKRVAIKKEKADITSNEIPMFKEQGKNDEFEEEQGAGQYHNGRIEQQFSEGYMGGSGRHRSPIVSTGGSGSCPVLSKIVQRCRGVDLLAGDRGQLFLPLCSLHQICYLCGEAPPTTCDLVFLSEADSTCEGDSGCQRAARSALMALRELHDALADELDGECEANPCLSATLKLNTDWQRALQR